MQYPTLLQRLIISSIRSSRFDLKYLIKSLNSLLVSSKR